MRTDAATAPLFADLPVPAPRVLRRAVYAPCNPALRTARDFANALVEATSEARRAECYRNMMAGLLAKDGV